jgi:hypothetical protein
MAVGSAIMPTVSINSSANNICAGTQVTFNATSNIQGGSFQWEVNNTPVGTGGTIYTYTPANNDTVQVTLTAPMGSCYSPSSVSSNLLGMSVQPMNIATVSLSGPSGAVVGMPVTVTATITNAPVNYLLNWKRNGTWLSTTPSVSMTYLKTAGEDTITAELVGLSGCYDTVITPPYIVRDITSVPRDFSHNGLRAYPNPFGNRLTLTGLKRKDKVLLGDISGRIIYRWVATEEIESFKLNDLEVGLYVL